VGHAQEGYRQTCGRCGARRVDHQLGLEPTPEEYVARMVDVFREVRRVLRSDGTLWLNMGDSYAAGGGFAPDAPSNQARLRSESVGALHGASGASYMARANGPKKAPAGLKPKDLVGIPWRLAFALQQPYYTGRITAERDRVWLAAILDGEGTICGMRHVRDDGNVRTGCMTFITNTSEALLDECDRIWPGSRYSEKVTSEASRPCWRWELQSAEDRSALVRELYPYLIEKRRQALVAWNLLEVVQAAKKLGRGGESDETKAKRELLVRILSDLNGRRAVDLPSWLREPPSLYEPGWYVRSDIVWSKSNPMPESVTDRPTKAHEYVFLLAKSPRYFFDQEAVREPAEWRRWGDQTYSPEAESVYGQRVKPRTKAELTPRNDGDRWNEANGRGFTPNQAGRNVRSVWEIATQPYPEAHFATYPEELVRRCILAGTSERGCCPECGKPWERDVRETDEYATWKARESGWAKRSGDLDHGRGTAGSGTNSATVPIKHEKLGWRPGCPCVEIIDMGEDDPEIIPTPSPVPCTVFDPFLGSGTTAHVARKHGRRSIGIELNEDYCRLIAERTQQLSLITEGV
jgi:DNA modification methylase